MVGKEYPMFCTNCGNPVAEGAAFCVKCGAKPNAIRPASATDDPVVKWLLPVGRSGFAIAAGYLALFSVLVVPAPLALLFGVLALRDIKKHPEKSGRGRAWFSIVFGGLFTILLVILLVVPAMK